MSAFFIFHNLSFQLQAYQVDQEESISAFSLATHCHGIVSLPVFETNVASQVYGLQRFTYQHQLTGIYMITRRKPYLSRNSTSMGPWVTFVLLCVWIFRYRLY